MEFAAGYQFGDLCQGYPQAFQGFGFVALQLAGAQLFGQYDPVAVAQVPRCQGQLAQFSEAFGAHADFFAQLALRFDDIPHGTRLAIFSILLIAFGIMPGPLVTWLTMPGRFVWSMEAHASQHGAVSAVEAARLSQSLGKKDKP